MKQVFEAQNTTEAHMIQNMLLQQNIHSHLQGEQLQAAVGELPTSFIRVIVEDENYLEAIGIIRAWEDKQPNNSKVKKKKKSFGITQLILGMILGAILTNIFLNYPKSTGGMDYNNDSNLDLIHFYNGTRLKTTHIDRNLDGEIDLKHQYNYQGIIKSSEADDDFNGTFETNLTYLNGNIDIKRVDSTGDGIVNYQALYTNSIISKATFINPENNQPIKIQYFNDFHLIKSELILEGDNQITNYNIIEEVITTN